MVFIENNSDKPTLHNPDLHKLVINELKSMKPGYILDIPSGPGYLIKELQSFGFSGIAAEIDTKLHCLKEINYKQIDMCNTFPFGDNTFDYIVSIEGIEHIENHFSFLREVKRVLKKDGLLILTTPNVHSLESRLQFFLSGFHSLAPKPIPVNTENIYFEHINPITLNSLCFICEKIDMGISKVKTSKFRNGSRILYYLLYPLIYLSTYKACFINEKDSLRRKHNKRIFKLLMSKENLMGGHLIITIKK